MKTNNKTETIAMSVFNKAALKHFKCQPDDIKVKMKTKNKEAFVEYKGEGYLISTREMLREDIEYQLTDKVSIHQIHFGCWIQATKNTVEIKRIMNALIRTIHDTEEANKLLVAIELGAYADDADVGFWEILSRIDNRGELLANAMIITTQIYNGPGLIDDLAELQIRNGDSVYNRFERGIFKTIYVNEQGRTFEFYLYSTDYYPTDK